MWYVLQVSTGQETAVRGELQKMNILALVPMENRLIRKGGGWTHKEYTLFPGYVFVNLEYTAENYYRVKEIPAVIRFLGASGLAPSQLTYLEAEWVKTLAGINGQPLQPTKVRELPDGSLKIVEDGVTLDYSEEEATKILSQPEVTVVADVKMGQARATAWGCDLTFDYVKINADYRS